MSSPSPRPSVLPASWADVLEQIRHGLEQAIVQTVEREQALPSCGAGCQSVPRTLEERRQTYQDNLEAFVRRAEQNAALAGEIIEAGAEAARRWQEAAADLRRRLAEWARRPV
ncbi:MAG TPA: hypothetical protein VNK04_14370 [Gemmataceae bacterium]|nr:hypothetical protein [Gemmataceae bacterium]